MEQGSLRVDANISIRRPGEPQARHQDRGEEPQLASPTSSGRSRRSASRQIGAAGGRRAGGAGDAPLQRGHRPGEGRSGRRRRATTTATSPIPTCRRSCSREAWIADQRDALPELPEARRSRLEMALRPSGLRRAGAHQRGAAGGLLRVGGRGRGRAQDRGQLGHGRRHDHLQRDRRDSRCPPERLAGAGRSRARGRGEPPGGQAGLCRAGAAPDGDPARRGRAARAGPGERRGCAGGPGWTRCWPRIPAEVARYGRARPS